MEHLSNEHTSELLAAKTLTEKFGKWNVMKSVLSLDKAPSVLEGSFKAAANLKPELPMEIEMEGIPLMELSSLAEKIHGKTSEAL